MKPHPITTIVPLAHQASLRIDDPAHLEITCTRGRLWLTIDHDRRDIILTAGSESPSFVTDGHRPLIVSALQDSQLTVTVRCAQVAATQTARVNSRSTHGARDTLLPLAAA